MAGVLFAGQLIGSFFTYTEGSRYRDEAILSGVLLGVSALLLLVTGRGIAATLVAAMVFGEDRGYFRLNSETHLNFLVPGCLLLGLALLLLLTLRLRR